MIKNYPHDKLWFIGKVEKKDNQFFFPLSLKRVVAKITATLKTEPFFFFFNMELCWSGMIHEMFLSSLDKDTTFNFTITRIVHTVTYIPKQIFIANHAFSDSRDLQNQNKESQRLAPIIVLVNCHVQDKSLVLAIAHRNPKVQEKPVLIISW